MAGDDQHPTVVFRVRLGREAFTCTGHLVWEGGIAFAIPDSSDDAIFVPEKVRLEESDLELRHDDEHNRDWYVYHGHIYIQNI